jgi:hypothetical protein
MLHWRTATPREIDDVQERIDVQTTAGLVSFSWRRGG